MPKAIWKYDVGVDEFSLEMPKGATILSAQLQRDSAVMWAMVDPEAPKETRHFVTIGTGHPISNPDQLEFIDTFQAQSGYLVIHVFEVKQDGIWNAPFLFKE